MELNKKKGQHYGAINLQSVHKLYRKYKKLAHLCPRKHWKTKKEKKGNFLHEIKVAIQRKVVGPCSCYYRPSFLYFKLDIQLGQ